MGPRFRFIDRETAMLLPPDLRDWVPADDFVHFVIEAVDALPMSQFAINHKGTGDPQVPPHVMLALLIYCYSHGRVSSRKIEDATWRDVAVRYLTGDTRIDHDTICRFRRQNLAAFQAAFVQVLQLARQMKLLRLGAIALDGTHMKADAALDQNISYPRAQQLDEHLQQDIQELLNQAEAADQAEAKAHPRGLPEELTRREKLRAKVQRASADLQARAQVQDQAAEAAHQAQLEQRAEREKQTGKKPRGPQPKPPQTGPEHSREKHNFTDPDSRILRKNPHRGTTQGYNAQAAVCAEGTQLILGQHLTQQANDKQQLEPGLDSIDERLGTPTAVLIDSGFANSQAIQRVEQDRHIEVYCNVRSEEALHPRRYDFRDRLQAKPPPPRSPRPRPPTDDRQVADRRRPSALRQTEPKRRNGLRHHQKRPGHPRL